MCLVFTPRFYTQGFLVGLGAPNGTLGSNSGRPCTMFNQYMGMLLILLLLSVNNICIKIYEKLYELYVNYIKKPPEYES